MFIQIGAITVSLHDYGSQQSLKQREALRTIVHAWVNTLRASLRPISAIAAFVRVKIICLFHGVPALLPRMLKLKLLHPGFSETPMHYPGWLPNLVARTGKLTPVFALADVLLRMKVS